MEKEYEANEKKEGRNVCIFGIRDPPPYGGPRSTFTASFRIPAGSFHSCQPTRKKARVMDKIWGRNKAITMHSTPVYRGQGRIYANKRILPLPIREISLYFGISGITRSSLGRAIVALISRIGRRCRASFLTASKTKLVPSISRYGTWPLLQPAPGDGRLLYIR